MTVKKTVLFHAGFFSTDGYLYIIGKLQLSIARNFHFQTEGPEDFSLLL